MFLADATLGDVRSMLDLLMALNLTTSSQIEYHGMQNEYRGAHLFVDATGPLSGTSPAYSDSITTQ